MEQKAKVLNVALTNRLSLTNKIARRLREIGCCILSVDVLSARSRVQIEAPTPAMLQQHSMLRRRDGNGHFSIELLIDEVTVQWQEKGH